MMIDCDTTILSTMTSDYAFDETVAAFLKRLNLPSHHPYIKATSESQNEDQYHEGRGHTEWRVMDYFTPRGKKRVPPKCDKAIEKQDLQAPSKTFSLFAEDDCPAPLTDSFCSDEKTNEGIRPEWFQANLLWMEEEYVTAKLIYSQLNETFHQIWPSLRASSHLTLRLFAPLILLGAGLSLVTQSTHEDSLHFKITCFIALSIMLLILTDECYIQEYGRLALSGLSCFILALVLHRSPTWQTSVLLTASFISLAVTMSMCCHIYVPKFTPGLYYSHDNTVVEEIISNWPVEKRSYHSTPWLVTGDSRTGVPFFVNFIPPQKFVRR